MKTKSILILIACVLTTLVLGSASGIANIESLKSWYPFLNKPPLNPPNWIFGPVWTTLYLLMGVALFFIVTHQAHRNKQKALVCFISQFVLNLLWSFLFFYFQQLGWALAEIVLMWTFIAATIYYSYSMHKWIAFLLIPYLLWVSFATYLNAGYWWLN